MKALAEALSFSVAFLASVGRNDDDAADDDCDALESITAIVREATPPELEAIRAASESAISTLLKSSPPNDALIQGYRDCIENFCNQTE
jgi:hypothetical protein